MSKEDEAINKAAELFHAVLIGCPNTVTAMLTACMIVEAIERHMGVEETTRVFNQTMIEMRKIKADVK
jgi:hypothetical protein